MRQIDGSYVGRYEMSQLEEHQFTFHVYNLMIDMVRCGDRTEKMKLIKQVDN